MIVDVFKESMQGILCEFMECMDEQKGHLKRPLPVNTVVLNRNYL